MLLDSSNPTLWCEVGGEALLYGCEVGRVVTVQLRVALMLVYSCGIFTYLCLIHTTSYPFILLMSL